VVLSEIEGIDFSSVIRRLHFHDCWLKEFEISVEHARLVIDYYNFEDTHQDTSAPWYELHFSFGQILQLDFALPTPRIEDLEIGSVEYNNHFNGSKNFYSYGEIERTINNGSTLNRNYLSVHIHLITRDDLGFGNYGYIKLLAVNCNIDACIEKARGEV
jgi:hypothetical protein